MLGRTKQMWAEVPLEIYDQLQLPCSSQFKKKKLQTDNITVFVPLNLKALLE